MRRLLALTAVLALAAGCGETATAPPKKAAAEDAGEFHEPAVEPVPEEIEGRWLLARVRKPMLLRRSPHGKVVARLGRRTEFGSPRVLHVVDRRGEWLEVVATELANGRRGWVPAAKARVYGTDMSIHVDRSERRLTLRRGGEVVHRMPIAVGRPDTPTPLGRFSVTDKLHPKRDDSPYGCCLLALSGKQPKLLEGWLGGDRLAIHATPSTWTIGKEASLGCMRGFPSDIRRIMKRVPLGAPVFVRA